MNENTSSEKLELYAFYWSLIRLVVAAISLIFGAMPIAYRVFGYSGASSLLPLCWFISGFASGYLLYMWFKNGKKLFGGTDRKNTIVFLIMIVTGLNLGYTTIGSNIGMNLVWDLPIADLLFKATGIVYLYVAYHMWKNWSANEKTLFETGKTPSAGTSVTPNSEPPSMTTPKSNPE